MHMVITVLILIIIMLTSCIFAYKERVEADEIHYEFICKKYKYEIEELKKDIEVLEELIKDYKEVCDGKQRR